MKLLPACALILTVGMFTAAAQAQSDTTVAHPALRSELLEMGKHDQEVREEIMLKQRSGEEITLADVARIDSVDLVHRERLKAIIAEHGWPTPSMVGPDAANAAFLIVQHADRDTDFQKMGLGLMQKAFEEGEARGQQIALLTDRVRVNEGKKQLYGTQANIEGGDVVLRPIEDSVHVDQRRSELGLPPLEAYINMLREVYLGEPAEEQN